MQRSGAFSAVALGALLVALCPASAGAATFNVIDSGWWDSGGFHNSSVKNYFAGGAGINDRNYFVFSLAGFSGTIASATLRLENPSGGYGSADPTETYTMFDVSTPIPTLMASGSGAANIPIFDDLGSGTILGSTVVTAASNGSIVQVTFSAAGIAYLQAAVGGLVAIGGALTSFDANPNSVEFVFGSSGATSIRQLDVQTSAIPEPSSAILSCLAFLVFSVRRRLTPTRAGCGRTIE